MEPSPVKSVSAEESQASRDNWDRKVGSVLSRVRKKSLTFLGLGLSIYGLGSVSIMYAMRANPGLATASVMFFFQLLVIIFSTSVIFPCIAGGFHVGLLANRESMPVFERVANALEGKDGVTSRLEQRIDQAALDIRETGDRIQSEIKRLADTMERPVQVPKRTLVGPPIPVESKSHGNGES